MNSVKFENQILDAIETVANNAVTKAGYDKTIKAVIISLEDATIGKYKVRYQDSEIEAYSNNIDLIYPTGTLVSILVPGNDFSQTKTILDAVEKGKVEYVTILEEDEQYKVTGENAAAANQMFGLCSYKEKDMKILFDKDSEINDINLDILSFEQYIQNSNNIICGAEFRTDLDNIQKTKGNFGIVYELNFKDNLTGDLITKAYKIDINQMVGNPYEQNVSTRQYGVFEINTENFDSINRVYIFSENFPNQSDSITRNDIYVGAFELSAANKITQNELDGYFLDLKKNGKGYFDITDTDESSILIQAILKQKNKVITNNINYYWFKEDAEITTTSSTYNTFGGEGWQCLNKYNLVDSDNDIRMFLTEDSTLEIKKEDILAGSVLIKCVVVRDNRIIATNQTKIINYATEYELTIESDSENQFYYDNGNPTLVCKINGLIENNNDYTYQWSYVDNNGIYQTLEETTDANTIYNAAMNDYEFLKSQVETGIAMAAASENELNRLKTIIDSYKYVQRVEGNTLYNIDLTQVLGTTVFKCQVKKNNILLGTAAYKISNTLAIEGEYHLEIINGLQTFNYTVSGIAPTNLELEKPITILPLSFEIRDNLGNTLGEVLKQHCEVQWTVPIENTMIIAEDSNDLVLNYSIADTFDSNKINNNTIKLQVKYKELILNAETSFTFSKDGDIGTNGTDVICKIVPNIDDTFNEYPMISNGVLNFTPLQTNKWFKVQLWENGQKIYDGIDGDSAHTITWSILKNTYARSNGSKVSDPANISVSGSNFSYTEYNANAASIIKVQVDYKGVTYYSTLPLIIATVKDNYSIKVTNNSGFRYVMYSSDGKRPQYDNMRPFEVKVTQIINGYEEDITNINNNYKPTYEWGIKGKIFNVASNNFIDDIHLSFENNSNLTENQKFFIPSEDYDGENVTNAVEVKILTANLTEIGKVLIPIHFYLDRYGLSDLAGWDGNKIALNDNTGSILAPQVGAGKKEADNTFSGVLMGTVKERASDRYEQGLFGYYKGQRSIFLDSDTGTATFGFNGKGQVIIDPTQGTAKLYGGNYKNNSSSGMVIDLTTPEIRFGSGNFIVNQYGHLTAQGGGKIAGWNIMSNTLSAGNIILNSNGSMSGGSTGHEWSINQEGKATFEDAEIHGSIYASNGTIGGWRIDPTSIYSSNGLSYMNSNGSAKFGNMIVNTNGGITATDMTANGGHFNDIVADGITAIRANINGILTAGSGSKIGGWTVSDNNLTAGDMSIKSDGSMSGNGWYINANGSAKFGNLMITNQGSVSTDGGTFTGSTFRTNYVSGSYRTILSSDGSFKYYNGVGFLTCGLASGTFHPWLSGINVNYINGIAFCDGIGWRDRGNQIDWIGHSGNSFQFNSGGQVNISASGSGAFDAKGYLAIRTDGHIDHNKTSQSIYVYAGRNITLHAGGSSYPNSYVYIGNGTSDSNTRAAVDSEGPSSRCLKTNITDFTKQEYDDALKLLETIKIYDYKYKYNIHPKKDQYGFIIDDLLENEQANKFLYFKDEKAGITPMNYLDYSAIEENKNYPLIEFKRYDEETLIKYLLVCCKALQQEINKIKKEG